MNDGSEAPTKPKRGRGALRVALSGALAALAFPMPGVSILAWFALAPALLAIVRCGGIVRAFAYGYLFGLVHFGWLVLWLGRTVADWSGSALGWIAWVALVAILSLWFGLAGASIWATARRSEGFAQAAAIAAVWTVVEWLRGQGALAMPWCLLGYSQYRVLPVIQTADLGGVYLIGFLLVLVNAAIMQVAQDHSCGKLAVERPWRTAWRSRLRKPAYLVLLAIGYGCIQIRASVPGSRVPVSAVQTNLRTTRGGNVADATELAILRQLNDEARGSKPALIVWPEGAAPGEGISDPGIADSLGELARSSGAYHLFGTAHRSDAGGAHNSAALFGPDGSLLARYDKQWLVPYGEWVPGRSWLPLLEALHAPGSDLEPGIDPRPVTKGPFSLGVMICFESVFPSISREQTRRGANLLALVTNDSWSGTQDVLWQHAAMTAFRAVENRRWVVMSATTGITGVVVSDGSVRTVPPAERGVLHAEAQLRGGLTPYTRFGDWFVACCAVLALAVIARRSATIFDTPRSPVV